MNKSIQNLFYITALSMLLAACASNPHEAKEIDTSMDNKSAISGDTHLGIKDGNLVVQKKVDMNEELRRLQNNVFSIEDKVYGNRKYDSKGLYGSLKSCRRDITSKKLGGSGKLMFTEPADRVTDKETTWDVGLDEKSKIVAVSEEFLKDRIARFRKYKQVLQKRQDEYEEKLEICDAKLSSLKHEMHKKE